MSDSLLFTNARIVDASQNMDEIGSLLVEDGMIAACGAEFSRINFNKSVETVDCNGNCIFPGMVDGRVFIGEPGAEHRETIASASDAAAAGGVTSMVMMPDTDPVIDDVALVEFVRRTADETADINVYPTAAVTRGLAGQEMTEIGLMKDAGAVAFTNGRKTISDSLLMRRALTYASDFDGLVMHYTQDESLARGGVMNEGLNATRLGLSGIPREAEIIPLERDLRLVALTGGRYHAATISTAESASVIAAAKAKGLPVTAGISINHLTLNENDIGRYRTFFRLSPPLRMEDDRQAMVEALRDGTIDIIVSNHDPQDVDTKRHPFAEAADGAVGLETLLAAALRLHHNDEVPLMRLIEAMTIAPARLFGLPGGSLEPGKPADLVIVDIDQPWVLNDADLKSRSKNTPFEDARFQGCILQTLVAGRTIYTHNGR
ncbi:MAG: dihydroorotase [Hyphomicrobiales bacterium]|nr:dihydroorotase [Hyphomicrobiales bacterium]